MNDHLYTLEDGWYVPTQHTGSPWSTTTQHGGPVNAVMMREAERFARTDGKRAAKLNIDILRPVPREPMRAEMAVRRTGRRLSAADVTLISADGKPLATARTVALKPRDDLPELFPSNAPPIPSASDLNAESLISDTRSRDGPPGFHMSIELRQGGSPQGGVCWLTSPLELIEGETVSPGQRCAAICDLSTVIAGRLKLAAPGTWDNAIRFDMLNTDTAVQFLRVPVGNWFALSDTSIFDCDGVGMTRAVLHDEAGLLGQVAQTVASNAP